MNERNKGHVKEPSAPVSDKHREFTNYLNGVKSSYERQDKTYIPYHRVGDFLEGPLEVLKKPDIESLAKRIRVLGIVDCVRLKRADRGAAAFVYDGDQLLALAAVLWVFKEHKARPENVHKDGKIKVVWELVVQETKAALGEGNPIGDLINKPNYLLVAEVIKVTSKIRPRSKGNSEVAPEERDVDPAEVRKYLTAQRLGGLVLQMVWHSLETISARNIDMREAEQIMALALRLGIIEEAVPLDRVNCFKFAGIVKELIRHMKMRWFDNLQQFYDPLPQERRVSPIAARNGSA